MKIYLLRHGDAQPYMVNPERPLSEIGKQDVTKLGKFLKNTALTVRHIWHSDKLRAKQTAELISDFICSGDAVKQQNGLAPMDDVDFVKDQIIHFQEDIMLVSHLPFLDRMAASLLFDRNELVFLQFKTASMVCLERGNSPRDWYLKWFISPQILTD